MYLQNSFSHLCMMRSQSDTNMAENSLHWSTGSRCCQDPDAHSGQLVQCSHGSVSEDQFWQNMKKMSTILTLNTVYLSLLVPSQSSGSIFVMSFIFLFNGETDCKCLHYVGSIVTNNIVQFIFYVVLMTQMASNCSQILSVVSEDLK